MRFFSPSTGGFYAEVFNGQRFIEEQLTDAEIKAGKRPKMLPNPDCSIPVDAIEITDDRHAELMRAQAEGKMIIVRNGRPVAVERKVPEETRIENRRRDRDRRLAESDWTQMPDALAGQEEVKAAWAAYRQQLRDLDMSRDDWPTAPGEEA